MADYAEKCIQLNEYGSKLYGSLWFAANQAVASKVDTPRDSREKYHVLVAVLQTLHTAKNYLEANQ